MTRIIPPFYEETIISGGEKKLFEMLKSLVNNYNILHSLGVAEHRDKIFGEIDFVIMCQKGILCLEVKGGYVRREDGVWCFTDRFGKEHKKTESPFIQAISAMQSLRKHLQSQFGVDDPVPKCQHACGVVFPDMPFTQKGPDIIPDIIFDTRNSITGLHEYFQKAFGYWRKNLIEKRGFPGGSLSDYHMERALNYLRGDFGYVPSIGDIVEKTEENLLNLTREQTDRLSIASNNKRIILRGGAGTGKTLLSLEYAKRAALRGDKVLYLSFNRNLYLHLQSLIENEESVKDFILVNTFHGYLNDFLEKYDARPDIEKGDKDTYYTSTLPEKFLEVTGQIPYDKFDTLVIDEGQDLLKYEYILCFDVMVKGGLQDGKWHICYDRNQNIYNEELDTGLEIIDEYRPTYLTLDTNCRNTKPVGIFNTLCTNTEPSRYFRVDGQEVVIEPYIDYKDERKKLINTVKNLIKEGVNPGDILLLSKYKFENSCFGGENIFKTICKFQNASKWIPKQFLDDSVKFCTIHSFKGLEAPVVILLDVKGFETDKDRALNYTGMSRAKSLLYVFYDQKAQDELNRMMEKSSDLLSLIKN